MISEQNLATDATPSSGGATSVTVAPALASVLYRVAEARGTHVRLDGYGNQFRTLKLKQCSAAVDALSLSLPWVSAV